VGVEAARGRGADGSRAMMLEAAPSRDLLAAASRGDRAIRVPPK
jgi:hypothetical protein